jgi:hypothetical protein
MHSLIGDRFLKKFAEGVLRRRSPISKDEAVSDPYDWEDMIFGPSNKENQDAQEKAALKNDEMVGEITKPLNQKEGLGQSSGKIQLPDESGGNGDKEIKS